MLIDRTGADRAAAGERHLAEPNRVASGQSTNRCPHGFHELIRRRWPVTFAVHSRTVSPSWMADAHAFWSRPFQYRSSRPRDVVARWRSTSSSAVRRLAAKMGYCVFARRS